MSSAFGVRPATTDRTLIASLLLSAGLHVALVVGGAFFVGLPHGGSAGRFSMPLNATLLKNSEAQGSGQPEKADFSGESPVLAQAAPVRDMRQIKPSPEGAERGFRTSSGAVGESPALLVPHYFPLSELDLPPYAREDVNADPDVLDLPQTGRVILELWVSSDGEVTKIEIIESNVADTAVAVIGNIFSRTRFVPARKGGIAVNARIRIEVAFAPPPLLLPRQQQR
jgi:TonB family protein